MVVIKYIPRSFLFTVLFTHFVASCAIGPRKKEPLTAPPNAQQLLSEVRSNIKKGENKKALSGIQQIISNHPDTDVADDALMIAGEYYFKKGDFNSAYDRFMAISNSEYFSPNEAASLYMASSSLHKMGRFDEALSLSQRSVELRGVPVSLKLKNYRLSYSIQNQLGDRVGALESLVNLIKYEPIDSKKKSYRLKAVEIVETRLTPKELDSIIDSSDFKDVQGYAYFQIGQTQFEQRDFRRARESYSRAVKALPNSSLAERAQNKIDQLNARRTVDKKTIGAILPLTGRHSKVAYRSLQGLQLGLGIYGKNKSQFKLAVIDSEGNPDIARRGVERLVTEDHVIGLVGSLLSKTSVAVASKADELGVPSIALSQRAGITEIGSSVFRNSLTSSMQVHHLVKTAMDDLKMTKFAILYPNDPYGVEYANLFWDAVLARGGEVVGIQAYDPKTTNFSDPIQRLVGTFYYEDREYEYRQRLKTWFKDRKTLRGRQSPPEDVLPPVVNFEALFVPDSARALGQIAPTLAYHDISQVKLLGTNLWNTASLIRLGKKYVDDAIFVDTFLKSDSKYKNTQFFKDFTSVYGKEPGLFEAQAYDAALLLRQMIATGESSRVGLSQRLSQKQTFLGANGPLLMTEHREIIRPLVTLTVHNNKITRVDQYPLEELFPTENKSDPKKRKSKKPRKKN